MVSAPWCSKLLSYTYTSEFKEGFVGGDSTGKRGMPMSNGGANNGSSVHILDVPVIVSTADGEGTGSTLNAKQEESSRKPVSILFPFLSCLTFSW